MDDDTSRISRRAALEFVLAAGAALAVMPAGAQSPSGKTALADLLTRAKLSGLALVATEGGRLIENVLMGAASPAFAVPVKNNTLFHIGSVGKHVTAVALLRLAERGKIDLDKPLSTYVSDISPAWTRPTLRQMLTHTSGLPGNFDGQALDRPFRREIAKTFSAALPPVAEPGQTFVYSNVGYVLLGFAIENVVGESYGQHVTDSVFRPHGLVDSRADDGEGVIPNRAEPMVWKDGVFRRAMQMSQSVSSVAAGGLLMSPRDVVVWEQALSGRAMLSDKSKAQLFADMRVDTRRGTGYAMGWHIDADAQGNTIYMHTGSVPGFRAFHFRAPKQDRALMVMASGEQYLAPLGTTAAETIWPGATPLGLREIPDKSPDLTAYLKALVTRAAPLQKEKCAPELARLSPAVAEGEIFQLDPEEVPLLRDFTLVGDTRTASDRQRRYVLELGDQKMPLLACYTPDNLIYRVGF